LGTFFVLYSIVYPIFKRPIFASYLVVLLIIMFIAFKLYKKVSVMTFKKTSLKNKIIFIGLLSVDIYLILMIFWYVFIHFSSYKIM
ncbi:MAG: hypothetical protein VXX85_00495, partial [Candidatus Margulisiibacteriota bacterium]|nr:hypothetical protein [Candidatus Margulisiibacteriota bacterium]